MPPVADQKCDICPHGNEMRSEARYRAAGLVATTDSGIWEGELPLEDVSMGGFALILPYPGERTDFRFNVVIEQKSSGLRSCFVARMVTRNNASHRAGFQIMNIDRRYRNTLGSFIFGEYMYA